MEKATVTIGYDPLLQCVTRIMAAYLPENSAMRVAECLVEADLRGVSSHGVTRLPVYIKRLRAGLLNPRPSFTITRNSSATAHMDGDNGMGYIVATKATDIAIELAAEHGVGMVTACRSNHFGMSATYVKQAFDAGFGAIVLTNAPSLMPVWGGRTPFLGTNPFAMGVPGDTPLLLDMATSTVAFGKIRRAARLGEAIPEGWALDAKGESTTDPNAAINGGVVLPMGGPKGSGLALLIEAVSGVMSGAAFGGDVVNQNSDVNAPQNVGHFFMVFDPGRFLPREAYEERMNTLVDRAKATEKAAGVADILMPGEIESRREEGRRRNGLALPCSEVEMLRKEARDAGFTAELPGQE